MNKKKSILLLLVLAMAISVFAVGCGNEDAPAEDPAENGEETGEETDAPTGDVGGQIIIGNSTEMTGEWGGSYFQNNAADKAIRDLIGGYSTVEYDKEGQFHLNETVVEELEVTEEDDTKMYTFKIREDLTYDDGSPITAEDYVANIMFWGSDIIGEMGGKNTGGQSFLGWGDYSTGATNVFEGVRLLGDYEFAFIFNPEEVPYFYELAMAASEPFKLDFWTDETVEILDDGEGAYFSENFTLENFEDRINEARFEVPRPSAGPYYLKSYDEAAKTAVIEINEEFEGNWEGQKPSIQTIIQKKVTEQTALDELRTGSIDILAELASGEEINSGFDLYDEGGFEYHSYPRAGYGNIRFSCDFGPTADKEVRQAIAHLLDRNDFAKSFTGGYGSVVHGPYGEGSWFYQETKDRLEVNEYPYDLERAIALLEEAGWVHNEEGGDYTEGVRYKQDENGELIPLVINWASTENNEVSDLLVIRLQENADLEEAGIKIEQTAMSFGELLNYMYRDASQGDKYGVPEYHMFNLASNFPAVYDRKNDVTTDPSMIERGHNVNRIIDEELEQASRDMVFVDPDQEDVFLDNFVTFIGRWNELLPDLPLYSNEYHDFYNDKLQNYETTSFYGPTEALLYSNVVE